MGLGSFSPLSSLPISLTHYIHSRRLCKPLLYCQFHTQPPFPILKSFNQTPSHLHIIFTTNKALARDHLRSTIKTSSQQKILLSRLTTPLLLNTTSTNTQPHPPSRGSVEVSLTSRPCHRDSITDTLLQSRSPSSSSVSNKVELIHD